jgi:hypothetical protein
MAERRMFAKSIIDTDAFLSMPLSTQALYFHLCMREDDDGFVSNPRKIQRMISCTDDDLKLLVAKRYILVFESGIIVIKHWKLHNYIRRDTYRETLYSEEKAQLFEKSDGVYTDHPIDQPLRIRDEPVDGSLTQDRIGKDRLGKVSVGKESTGVKGEKRSRFTPPTLDEVKTYCKERGNIVDAQRWLDYYTSNGWMVGKNHMKDWKAAVRTWERGNNQKSGGGNVFMEIAREEGIIRDK